jgi:hypothetical protein
VSGSRPTSAVINLLDTKLAQSNASLNSIYLIGLGGGCKHEKVAVQEAYQILAIYSVTSLPGDMEHTAKMDVAKCPYRILRASIGLRGGQKDCGAGVTSFCSTYHVRKN